MLTVTELIYYCDLRCFDGGLFGAAHRDIEPVPEPVCKNLHIKKYRSSEEIRGICFHCTLFGTLPMLELKYKS